MQLHLEFRGRNVCLPLAYRHFVQGLIYHALESDPGYSAMLHDGTGEGRQFKLFTFGQLEGSYTIRDRQICFCDGMRLEIRSIRDDLLLRLLQFFHVGRQIRLGNNDLTVTGCRLENVVVQEREILIATRSPIVAYVTEEDGKTRFFSPEEEAFYTMVVANARRKWQSSFGDVPFSFSITPGKNARFRKQVTMFKDTRITAWDGRFRIMGDPQVLNFLYHTGLGSKSSQGFGMFRLL